LVVYYDTIFYIFFIYLSNSNLSEVTAFQLNGVAFN